MMHSSEFIPAAAHWVAACPAGRPPGAHVCEQLITHTHTIWQQPSISKSRKKSRARRSCCAPCVAFDLRSEVDAGGAHRIAARICSARRFYP